MVIERTPVQINPDSEFGLVLRRAAAAGKPVLIDVGDELYEFAVQPVTGAPASATTLPHAEQIARSIAGIRKAGGRWKGLVDVAQFTTELFERRRVASRPSVEL